MKGYMCLRMMNVNGEVKKYFLKLPRTVTLEPLIKSEMDEYEERIEKMLSNSFNYVIESIKTYKATGNNKFNGFFGSDAIRYFDYKLYKEHKKEWGGDNWCKPCTTKWYKKVEKYCRW